MIFTISIHPNYGPFEVQSLVVGALPLAFAAVAETCVVLGGGIDLSIGAMMAVANVLAARSMQGHDFATAILISIAVLAGGTLAGALSGVIAVRTKVPDIVVTLAMSFVWGGVALLILAKPGGGAPDAFLALAGGNLFTPWVPNGILLLIAVVAVVWVPIRLGRLGLALYAVGSDRTAAFRRGVKVGPARGFAYAVGGFFGAWGRRRLLRRSAPATSVRQGRWVAFQGQLRDRPSLVLIGVLLLLVLVIGITRPGTIGPTWIANTILFAAPLGIVAAGQTLVMLTAGIDLSVAAVMTAAAYVAASQSYFGSGRAVLLALGIGLLIGLANRLGVAVFRMQPLIMTLS